MPVGRADTAFTLCQRSTPGCAGGGQQQANPEGAARQVVSFYSRAAGAADDNWLLLKANSLLPHDIRVMRLAAAPPDFIARFSNVGKVRACARAAAQPTPPEATTAAGAHAVTGSLATCVRPLGFALPDTARVRSDKELRLVVQCAARSAVPLPHSTVRPRMLAAAHHAAPRASAGVSLLHPQRDHARPAHAALLAARPPAPGPRPHAARPYPTLPSPSSNTQGPVCSTPAPQQGACGSGMTNGPGHCWASARLAAA
jgi:hypothetical protein